jgi:hypothetical protein
VRRRLSRAVRALLRVTPALAQKCGSKFRLAPGKVRTDGRK